MSIRENERHTGWSRNTIRKYLRSDAVEVKFKMQARPSRLDTYADKLAEWLRVEAGKGRGRVEMRGGCMLTWWFWATMAPMRVWLLSSANSE